MGIFLTLKAEFNATGIDQHNCYGRVSNLHYHFKTKTLKATVSIYLSKQIGALMRPVEAAQKDQMVRVFESNKGEAMPGAIARQYQMAGDPIYQETGLMFHPQFIFSDTYVIPVDFATVKDEAAAYAIFYEKIKRDNRFLDVIDDLEPDPQGEQTA